MNDIEQKINEMFDKLEESNTYKQYCIIKDKLINNKDIMSLIEKIKRYQKIYVNSNDSVVDKQLNELNRKLESYPLYQSYLIKKDELNNELCIIKNIFEKYFNDLLSIK